MAETGQVTVTHGGNGSAGGGYVPRHARAGTALTGAQVREVQWASSDEGKAQVRAAWERAVQLGLTRSSGLAGQLTMPDVGALIWAAREAAPPP